jgi:triphosphoribosyl-dephospho-CoA synthetase
MLQLERVASFDEELEKRSRGFTSKAALVAASLGLAPNVASEDWDVLF